MGYAPREDAQPLEFLRVLNLRFEPATLLLGVAALCDVPRDALDPHRFAFFVNDAGAYLDRDAAAVFGRELDLIPCDGVPLELPLHHLTRQRPVLRRGNVDGVHAERLFPAIPADLLARLVQRREPARKVMFWVRRALTLIK